MKNLIILLHAACACLLCGCEKTLVTIGSSRADTMTIRDTHRRGSSVDGGGSVIQPMDTTIWMTAVEYPEGYDWRRDSLRGRNGAKLVLYRDGARFLEIDTGELATADPDMHHFMDGWLYTEITRGDRTCISRNGKALLGFEGREALRGIFCRDSHLYTLTQMRSGRGIRFRCDEQLLFEDAQGVINGTMMDWNDRNSGALYEDGGHICFAFHKPMGKDMPDAWYLVEDGVENRINADENRLIQDAALIGGGQCLVYIDKESGRMKMSLNGKLSTAPSSIGSSGGSLHILRRDGIPAVLSRNRDQSFIWDGTSLVIMGGPEDYLFYSGETAVSVGCNTSGMLQVFKGIGARTDVGRGYVMYSARNGCLLGADTMLALTSAVRGQPNMVWKNGKATEMDFNGCLTGIYYDISPAR